MRASTSRPCERSGPRREVALTVRPAILPPNAACPFAWKPAARRLVADLLQPAQSDSEDETHREIDRGESAEPGPALRCVRGVVHPGGVEEEPQVPEDNDEQHERGVPPPVLPMERSGRVEKQLDRDADDREPEPDRETVWDPEDPRR